MPESCRIRFAISEGLRKEESANNNIRVTIISPGAVSTELTQSITDMDLKHGIDEIYKGAIDAESIALWPSSTDSFKERFD